MLFHSFTFATLKWNFQFFLQFLAIIVMNAIVNPWLLIPAAVMTFLFYLMRMVYVNTGRGIKRIEALSRSTFFAATKTEHIFIH